MFNKVLAQSQVWGGQQATAFQDYIALAIKYVLGFGGAIVVLVVFYVIWVVISKRISRAIKSNIVGKDEHAYKVADLVWNIAYYVIFTIGFVIAFSLVGIDLSIFLWGLSIGIWFALKQLLENFVAWLLVLTTKEFKIGDIIEIVTPNYSYMGRIEEINVRYSVLKLLDLRKVVVPNIDLITNPLKTFSSEEFIRLTSSFSVSHLEDIDKIEKIVSDAVRKVPGLIKLENIAVLVSAFNEFWVVFKVVYFAPANFEAAVGIIQSRVNKAIKKALDEHNISISYPHLSLTVDKNDPTIVEFLKNKLSW